MMARAQEQIGRMRFPWMEEEDRRLVEYMQRHDEPGCWSVVPNLAGLKRSGKSCRLRWTSYKRPGIKRGPFSEDEVATILRLQMHHGNKWATIAAELPGRTNTQVKNWWHTRLNRQLPNATSITAALSETSMVNQVLEIGEIPFDPEIVNPCLKKQLPNATSITAASSETSMVSQVLEIGEIPFDPEIVNPSFGNSTTFDAWMKDF